MPSFDGQVDEEQLIQLVTYIKSLAEPIAAAQQGEGGDHE